MSRVRRHSHIKRILQRHASRAAEFVRNDDGPTAVEYAFMITLILIAALGAITLLGNKLNTFFTNAEAGLPDGT